MQLRKLVLQRGASVASNGVAVFLARLLSFGLFIFTARNMSAADNASLIYMVGISQLIVQLASLGWLNIIRRISATIDKLPAPLASGFVERTAQIPMATVFVASIVIIAFARAGLFGASTATNIQYAALISLTLTANAILREYLAGLNRPTTSTLLSETIPLGLSFFLLWATHSNDANSAFLCLIAANLTSTAIQAVVVFPRLKPFISTKPRRYETSIWTRAAAFSVVGYGSKMLMDRTDAIFLAPIAGLDQLAYFNSAVRLASIVLIIPVILIPVFSARVSAAFHSSDYKQLRLEVVLQLAAIAAVILPAAILILLSPAGVLGRLFGANYSAAGDVLWLILVSQSLFAISLPFSNFLLMTDGEVPYAGVSFVALIVAFSFAYLLIPEHGIHGAAIAMFAGNSVLLCGLLGFAGPRLWPRNRQIKETEG